MSTPIALPMSWLRGIAEQFMPDTAAIARYTSVSTSDGIEQTWSVIATGLPCQVWPIGISAAEAVGATGGLRALSTWNVRLPALTDVTHLDRISVSDGRTFEVQEAQPRSYEAARDCICKLMD
jgi:hypothetical protein